MKAAAPSILRWPLPALAAWAACWLLQTVLSTAGAPAGVAFAWAGALGLTLALRAGTRWRALIVAAGFPLSTAVSILSKALPAAAVGTALAPPSWAWLLPLGLLALLYPMRAWRDAPLYPTPAGALAAMPGLAPLPPGARVLDAGCGAGDGLLALRAAYPAARIEGVEWSWPLRATSALRCPWARVRRADLWHTGWSGCALVYVFQRPESMPALARKAAAELAPGAWFASLAFAADEWQADHVVAAAGHHLYLYRAPLRPAGGASVRTAGPN